MNPTKEQLQDPQWWQDNAPEGATHFHPDAFCVSWCWVKVNDCGIFFSYHTPEYPWEQWIKWDTASQVSSNFVKRPTAIVWNGEGLPPAGLVCEVSNCGNPFEICTIRYMGPELCVVDHTMPHRDQHYHLSSVKFRPLRTPEQIAEEEREKAIKEMFDVYVLSRTLSNGIAALYDAGYRDSTEVLAALEDLAKAYRQAVGLGGAYDKALLKAESILSK